jgi:uncharacterized protein YoaH (UPF0181 family)
MFNSFNKPIAEDGIQSVHLMGFLAMKKNHSKRKKNHAKVMNDTDTQHSLWVIRIQELMALKKCSSHKALELLTVEVDAQIKEKPQRSQDMRLCWAAFIRRINQVRS